MNFTEKIKKSILRETKESREKELKAAKAAVKIEEYIRSRSSYFDRGNRGYHYQLSKTEIHGSSMW